MVNDFPNTKKACKKDWEKRVLPEMKKVRMQAKDIKHFHEL
jgi:hypothetical protein